MEEQDIPQSENIDGSGSITVVRRAIAKLCCEPRMQFQGSSLHIVPSKTPDEIPDDGSETPQTHNTVSRMDWRMSWSPTSESRTTLAPQATPENYGASAWFGTADKLYFQIMAVDGNPVFYTNDTLDQAVNALDLAAFHIDDLEARIGVSFDPVTLVAAPSENTDIMVLTKMHINGATQVAIAIDQNSEIAAHLQLEVLKLPAVQAAAVCTCTLILAGPDLDIDTAASLAVGDMLLLPAHVQARIIAGSIDGVTDMAELPDYAQFPDGVVSFTAQNFTPGAPSDPNAQSAFMITPMLCLPDIRFRYGQLVDMQHGASLALPPLSKSHAVRMMLGETVVATGHIAQSADMMSFIIAEMMQNIAEGPLHNIQTTPTEAVPQSRDHSFENFESGNDATGAPMPASSPPIWQAG